MTSGVRFPVGSQVRARTADPDHHTRLPRYLHGQVGDVVAVAPATRLPDDVARGLPEPRVEPVYAVRFHAADLWGSGAHTVTADLWECYLEESR
ncbi:MAG TPA: SH3-like domain-containing protein [Streptosporangiaceae bacterium]|jgi:nitrile hydratase|nr:SH3-like domain-containing protein [Streptosporangiaceae bacterium]